MSTINYQGQWIEVELIDETNSVVGEGSDTIYRDEAGIYYLERDRVGFKQKKGGRASVDFNRVHRINITAAILWSIGNGEHNAMLRHEAAACLMDTRIDRAITDPNPHRYHEIKAARGKQSAVKWVKKVLAGTALPAPEKPRTLNEARAAIGEPPLVEEAPASNDVRQFTDGSMALTLYLKPDAARLFRAACGADDMDEACFLYEAMQMSAVSTLGGGSEEREQGYEAVFEKDWPEPASPERHGFLLRLVNDDDATVEEGSLNNAIVAEVRNFVREWRSDWSHVVTRLLERGRDMTNNHDYIVELDQRASALLYRYERKKGITNRDVVNGLVVNWLEAMLQIHEGRTDTDAMTEAMWRRTGITDDEDENVADVTPQPGDILRLLWDRDGIEVDEVELDPRVCAEVKSLAARDGLSFVDAFNRWFHMAMEKLNAQDQTPPDAENAASVEDEATGGKQLPARQFSFEFKPTRKTAGRYIRIEVSGNAVSEVDELAKVFGLTPRAFLRKHLDDTLPQQPTRHFRATEPLAEMLQAAGFTFKCADKGLTGRIARAAAMQDQAVEDYIAVAVGNDVDSLEEGMIVHPQTGELLCNYGGSLYRQLEMRETAPLIGQEANLEGAGRQTVHRPKGRTVHLLNPGGSLDTDLPLNADQTVSIQTIASEKGMTFEQTVGWLLEKGLPLIQARLASGRSLLDSSDDDTVDADFMAGRGRHAGNPADIALLATAEPEPVEEAPPDESKDDNEGEEWKEGK